jgi:predicted lipoprotein with Yx(FWY)xxD motif
LAVLSVAAACGDDDASSTDAPTTESTDPDPATATVELVDSDLGGILASEGRTLYLFMTDAGGASTCYDDCATTWPPLVADGEPTVAEGLDASLFATATRDDGEEQMTVDGWPLYFFSGDSAPGDTNGQGVGDVWYVVAPGGEAIGAE